MLSCHEMRDALAAIGSDLTQIFPMHENSVSSAQCTRTIISTGFKLSNRNFNSVMQRYTNREGSIELEDFLVSASRLRIAFRKLLIFVTGNRL